MSPLPSLQPIHHYGYSLDSPTRKPTIALALILRVLEYPFKLSNNQVEVSKYSITADTAIRIVHYPAGVHNNHTRVITYRLVLVSLQAGVGRGWTPRHYLHVTFSNP